MTDFEKDLLTFLAGKHPQYLTPIEYDLIIKPSICKTKSASLPRVCDDEPALLRRNLTIIVAAVIIDNENKVLLIQEAKKTCRGLWYLPAGRLEENETIEEGVKREVKEEAGIDFEPSSLICIECYPGMDSAWVRFTYTGKVTGGKLKTEKEADHESIQATWFPVRGVKDQSEPYLRAKDILPLIDACETHQTLAASAYPITPVLPSPVAHKYMCNRVVLARKTNDNFEVLISTKGTTTSHLPVFRDFACNWQTAFQEIFGSEISTLKGHSGILCAEHAGKSHEIYADGVCLTILIFTTTDKNPKDRNEFIWHRIRNASIIEDLEKRLQRPESSIPLFTHM